MTYYVNDTLEVTLAPSRGIPTPTTTQQWLRNGVAIPNATELTYTITEDDLGSALSVLQTSTNVKGTDTEISDITDLIKMFFTPTELFADSEEGAWYDPSDLSTLFQDAAGTTPVTAAGQPVGLMLDKSKGLLLGPELVTNGAFDTDTAWTKELGWTISAGTASIASASGFTAITQLIPLVVGRTYEITFSAALTAGGLSVFLGANGSSDSLAGSVQAPATSFRSIHTFKSGAAQRIVIRQENGATASIDNISVRELPGNHAAQATAAKRPIYGFHPFGGRRNMFTFTENFANADWAIGSSIEANTTSGLVAPDGTLTADSINFSQQFNNRKQHMQTVGGQTYTATFYARSTSASRTIWVIHENSETGNDTSFTATSSWQKFTISFLGKAGGGEAIVGFQDRNVSGFENIEFWHPQVEIGATATAYQKVVTQDEVTEAGVPLVHRLRFNGLDDAMATAEIDFTGTDKVSMFAGVRKLSDAVEGHILEFSSNFDSNDSTFGLQAPGGMSAVADSAYVGVSKGTVKSFTGIALSSFPAPISNVVSLLSDISADTITLCVNGTQVSTSALNQGTGNYGNYPLYIGARASSSLFFNGNLYGLIITGKMPPSSEIAATEAYMAAKTGVTL